MANSQAQELANRVGSYCYVRRGGPWMVRAQRDGQSVTIGTGATYQTALEDALRNTKPPQIRTEHVHPPIPIRAFDWSAIDSDTYNGEPGEPIGRGATEAEAIADLMGQLDEARAGERDLVAAAQDQEFAKQGLL